MSHYSLDTSLRNWCFTTYSEQPPRFNVRFFSSLIYQKEICPSTGREHWQGCFQLFKGRTFEYLKYKSFVGVDDNQIHLEPTNNVSASVQYCQKTATSVPGTLFKFHPFEDDDETPGIGYKIYYYANHSSTSGVSWAKLTSIDGLFDDNTVRNWSCSQLHRQHLTQPDPDFQV